MHVDSALERPEESGDTFKEGFYILGWFSLGSDSQAAKGKQA